MSNQYEKSQFAKSMIIPLLIPIVIILVVFQSTKEAVLLPLIFMILIFVVAIMSFYKLKVTVDSKTITVIFGIGIIRKKFLLKDIASCEATKNSWWYGYGIRMLPNGWLYNVSGTDAVEIKMKNGRANRIGTADPQGLCHAIKKYLKK